MKTITKKTTAIILCFTLIACLLFQVYFISFPKPYREEVKKTGFYDEELLYSVMKAESGFYERAESGAGAVGLMQLLPTTAKYLCEKYSIPEGDLFEPEKNISLGAIYLEYLSEKFFSLEAVLAAYNAGEGRVMAWLKDADYSPDGIHLSSIPYPETEDYVQRVKKNYKIYKFFY